VPYNIGIAVTGAAAVDGAPFVMKEHSVVDVLALIWGVSRYARQVPDIVAIEPVLSRYLVGATTLVPIHNTCVLESDFII